MKVRIACISIGLALAAAHGPATAADWNNGGGSIKDMNGSAAIPVPAPVPIPVMRAAWYFRMDAGVGKIAEPDLSEQGFIYGEADGPADPLYMDPSWFKSDFNTLATFGAGVGYNFGRFRLDATIEKRSKDDIEIDGERYWDAHSGDPRVPVAPTVQNRIDVRESAKIDGTVWMLNGYFDLFQNRGFTPYVGAGAGFSWNHFERIHDSTVFGCAGGCANTTPEVTHVQGHADKVSLAAALMAGISYDVTEITTIDMGYRYLYIAGSDVVLNIDGDLSHLEVGDQHVHQFRAGLRFNVN